MQQIEKLESLKILNGDFSYEMWPGQPNLPEVGIKSGNGPIYTKPETLTRKEINSFLKKHLDGFKKNLFCISNEFADALDHSKPSFAKLIEENNEYLFQHIKYETGVYTVQNRACYYHIDKKNKVISFAAFVSNKLVYAIMNLDISSLKHHQFVNQKLGIYLPGYTNPNDWNADINTIVVFCFYLFNICIFRTFADHEYKIITGKSSGKLNNVVYKNNNKQNVLALDSTWYTSIVRTEGFAVRGHLRMQACGKNFSERKLIYIDSFEKHGYVRKAKMLPRSNPSISTITEALYE